MIYQPLTHRWGGALFLHRPFCHLQTGERWLHRFARAKLWLKKKELPSCCPLRVDVTWRAPRLKIEAKRRGERRNVVAVPTAGVSQVAQKTRCIVENRHPKALRSVPKFSKTKEHGLLPLDMSFFTRPIESILAWFLLGIVH